MELDLGIADRLTDFVTGRVPTASDQTRHSRALWKHNGANLFPKHSSRIALPVLPDVTAAKCTASNAKVVAEMRTGSVGAPVWGVPFGRPIVDLDRRQLVF